jgi:hypothetical protein
VVVCGTERVFRLGLQYHTKYLTINIDEYEYAFLLSLSKDVTYTEQDFDPSIIPLCNILEAIPLPFFYLLITMFYLIGNYLLSMPKRVAALVCFALINVAQFDSAQYSAKVEVTGKLQVHGSRGPFAAAGERPSCAGTGCLLSLKILVGHWRGVKLN